MDLLPLPIRYQRCDGLKDSNGYILIYFCLQGSGYTFFHDTSEMMGDSHCFKGMIGLLEPLSEIRRK